jgi:hypothetical protein
VGRDNSDKICQIAGFPVRPDPTNCSSPHDGKISYWSYYKGSASGWAYSSLGDAAPANRVRPDIVEGWSFVEIPVGETKSFDPPRNFIDGASYLWESTCPVAALVTMPPQTAPSRTPENQAARPPAATRPPTAGAPQGGGGGTTTTRPGATSTGRPRATTATARDARVTSSASGLRSSETAPRLSKAQVEAAAEAAEPSSRPVGAIVAGAGGVGAVVLGLAIVTGRSRRRRLSEEVAD